MKKITLVFALAFLGFVGTSFAQWEGKGSKDLNVGVGLGSRLGGGLPIGVSYDMGYNENISIGGYVGYAGYSQDFGAFKYTYTNILIAARGAYHYPLVDNIDTYGGFMLGYNVASAKSDLAGAPAVSAGGLIWGFFVGGRYMFTEKIGAMAELGNGIAWLQAGITVKL